MSFDDDADVPMNDLMKQGCVSHQTVISLIGGARRMAPDGALADSFVVRGYPVDSHPLWFGTRQQLDASLGEVDATLVEPVELGALVDETVDDTVYTPKNAVPKEQGSQVTHNAAQRTTTATQRGATKSPSPPPGSTNTISAAQQNLLQQNGVTYEVANAIWVRTTPLGAGQYVKRVNPVVELRKLQQEASQRNYTENIADDLLDTLSLTTQAFLKKVARVSHET